MLGRDNGRGGSGESMTRQGGTQASRGRKRSVSEAAQVHTLQYIS